MTLKHVKEYLETLTLCKQHLPLDINNVTGCIYSTGRGALGLVWDSGHMSDLVDFSIPERIRILEELVRPKDKKKVSEFLLEQTGFDLSRKNGIIFRWPGKTYPICIYDITNGTFTNGSWYIISAQALCHIADAKELLETGELING
jgi:hypothetical protein